MQSEVDPHSPEGEDAAAIRRNLDSGLAHHFAGRLTQAEAQYRDVLQHHPDHPDALHLLGMVAFQTGRADTAVDLIQKAIAIDPANADYQFDFGDVRRFQGRLDDAAACYRNALALRPDHPESHFNLGNVLAGQGNLQAALDSYRHALALKADYADAHNNMGNALARLGRHADAVASFQEAIALVPRAPDLHFNLGNARKQLRQYDDALASYADALARNPDHWPARFNSAALLRFLGRPDEAIAALRTIVAAHPGFAEAHYELGLALRARGNVDEAIACLRTAVAIRADLAPAHNDLGIALADLGRLDEAVASYRSALALDARFAMAHNNLGNALHAQGATDDAIACYRAALALEPEYAEAHNNLGNALDEAGMADAALACYRRALQCREILDFKMNFARCAMNVDPDRIDADSRALIEQALAEPWARPADLARICIGLVKTNPAIRGCIDRAVQASPEPLPAEALFGTDGLTALSADTLLRTLLQIAPVADADLERLLTRVRRSMLDAAEKSTTGDSQPEATLAFHCAVARQCQINEYVFATGADEIARAGGVRERLAAALVSGEDVSASTIVVSAAYFPLVSLPRCETLLQRQWPDAISALLAQQIAEPLDELRYRDAIPVLTPIDDVVSRVVQQQYEENPYPRWLHAAPQAEAPSIDAYLRRRFPFAPLRALGNAGGIDILIAGCGTGQQPIETARRFPAARILAVDLSRASLAYAIRKSRESDAFAIEYAQADLLAMRSAGRMFDVIEAVGVLHHLADPMRGWRELVAMLRPGGVMLAGLYSERARQAIVAARQFIADEGYGPNAADIRRCRQQLLAMDRNAPARRVTAVRDFYTTSECRDLLFHAQEQRFTLPQVEAALRATDMTLLGFVLEPRALHAYGRRFPDDRAKTDLAHWDIFETERPDTFAGMYTFWMQKPA